MSRSTASMGAVVATFVPPIVLGVFSDNICGYDGECRRIVGGPAEEPLPWGTIEMGQGTIVAFGTALP